MTDKEFIDFWDDGAKKKWDNARNCYWKVPSVKKNETLEKMLYNLDISHIEQMDGNSFYGFLLNQYFPWKYTDCRWKKQSIGFLENWDADCKELQLIKQYIFEEHDHNDCVVTKQMIKNIKSIPGVGVAGATGLLSVLFPQFYGTVDSIVVRMLKKLNQLDEYDKIIKIHENDISLNGAVLIEELYRKKAIELNSKFKCDYWTPREVEMVIWTLGHKNC